MKKLLVTGSSGMLGRDIVRYFTYLKDYEIFGVDLINSDLISDKNQFLCDLTDLKKIKYIINKIKPSIVIHCAAIVNLKKCEENKKLAYDLHCNVTSYLAGLNSKLIYISTDSVFDGKKGNYFETDKVNPINYYAQSKLEGEKFASNNKESIIIRTNIYGFSIPFKNSLAEWSIKNFLNNNKISGFEDIYFNPIYTYQLANFIFLLLKDKFKGIINICSKNPISKYEFLHKILLKFNFSEELLEKSSVSNFNFEIKRPKNTVLNTDKLDNLYNLPTIDSGIDMMYNDYKSLDYK